MPNDGRAVEQESERIEQKNADLPVTNAINSCVNTMCLETSTIWIITVMDIFYISSTFIHDSLINCLLVMKCLPESRVI